MTIDTSREAVERLRRQLASKPDATRFDLTRKTVDALLAERDWAVQTCEAGAQQVDAALAEVARLSTPPDDGLIREAIKDLESRIADADADRCADDVDAAITGERPDLWDYDITLSVDTARQIVEWLLQSQRLSHALAAETAKREAMEEALRTVETDLAEAEDKFHIASFYISDEQTKTCVMDRVKWMAKAGSRVRATLAKHGSKT